MALQRTWRTSATHSDTFSLTPRSSPKGGCRLLFFHHAWDAPSMSPITVPSLHFVFRASFSAASPVSADRGVQVSVFCSAPIQAGFPAPRPFRRESGCTCYLFHIHPFGIWVFLLHVLAHPHLRCPDGLRARHRSVRWDVYGPDHRFDPLRPPVFVEGGGASPAGWPLHRITSALHIP